MSLAKTARILPAHFVLRRLHSLTGLVPIGIFVLAHVFTGAHALVGKAAYEQKAAAWQGVPFIVLFEILLLGLPILFHAFYGLVIVSEGRTNVHYYPHAANWRYLLQRVTGILSFAFIGYHVFATRFSSSLTGASMSFDQITGHLSDTRILILYLVGTISVSFHLANGLWSAAIVWGLTVTKSSQRLWLQCCALLFVILSFVNVLIILSFAYPEGSSRPDVVAALLDWVRAGFFRVP